jgi:SAM-dependent methyltransferase
MTANHVLRITSDGRVGLDEATIVDDVRDWVVAGDPVPTYAQILERWGRRFKMYRDAWDDDEHDCLSILDKTRDYRMVPEFGFSIPCAEVLGALWKLQPIVEVGAGSGYWTALMRHIGIEVVGTDPDDHGFKFTTGKYDPDQARYTAAEAVMRWPEHTVFCSWPSYKEDWFRKAMEQMRSGQYMVLIREDACCDEDTWDWVSESFDQIEYIPIPAWPGMNDHCGVWRKL